MSRVFAVVALAVLLLAGGVAINAAYHKAGDATTVENETFTPSAGINALDNSDRDDVTYGAESTVTVRNNTSVVTASGNWSWVQHNGTVDVANNSYLDNRSSANITYEYATHSSTQTQLAQLFGGGIEVARLLLLVLVVFAVVAAARMLGGM